MNKDTFVLTVDLGTSGPKLALVDKTGVVVDFTIGSTQLHLIDNDGAEQSPTNWWEVISAQIHLLLDRNNGLRNKIVAICCTAQWSGTVAVDRNGKALMNSIIWMDSRGAQFQKKITDGLINVEGYGISKLLRWLRKTGGAPSYSGKDPLAHILYIKNEHHEIYQKTYKFLEPKDYLNLLFSGKFAASFDSIALHWVTDNRNINQIKYDSSLIRMSGIDKDKLPELKRATDVLGDILPDIAKTFGLNPDTKIITGTPDIQSAAIGSGAVRDFEGHLYIGTSAWLTSHVPFKKTDLFHNMASLPSAIPNRYFIANEQETAGYCLTFLKDNLIFPKTSDPLSVKVPEDVYGLFNDCASLAPPGSNALIFTPWLFGERTPVEDKYIRGGFFNMTLNTTRSDMIRAVFEGVAYNSKWLLKYVEKFQKRRLDTLNFIGGGAQSDLWCQIHADVLNRTIKQVEDPLQANVRGAAYIALVALEILDFEDISTNIKIKKVYHPISENVELYGHLFKKYLEIYKASKKICQGLNKRIL